MKVIILKWLPASWKSTRAKNFMKDNKNFIRVNKDLWRGQYHFSKFSKSREKFTIAMRNLAITTALWNNKNVIVDDTNFNEKHEIDIRRLADAYDADIEIKFINTWPDTCKIRNKRRSKQVPDFVIDKMYEEAILLWYNFVELDVETYKWNDKPKAVIFDIDWTLAKMNWRSPYDYSSELMADTLSKQIWNIYNMYKEALYNIIIFTWRKEEWDKRTQQRLLDNDIHYTEFRWRKDWDDRNDAIIKKEFFDELKDKYNIEIVFDDRNRVVDMYRWLGLTVCQVDYWDF